MGRPWFGPKRYGIGLGPSSPAGWLAVLVYAGLMAGALPPVRALGWPDWAFAGIQLTATALLLTLVMLKRDRRPMKWRWGDRR